MFRLMWDGDSHCVLTIRVICFPPSAGHLFLFATLMRACAVVTSFMRPPAIR